MNKRDRALIRVQRERLSQEAFDVGEEEAEGQQAWWLLLSMFAGYEYTLMDQMDLRLAWTALMMRGEALGILDEARAKDWSTRGVDAVNGCALGLGHTT